MNCITSKIYNSLANVANTLFLLLDKVEFWLKEEYKDLFHIKGLISY